MMDGKIIREEEPESGWILRKILLFVTPSGFYLPPRNSAFSAVTPFGLISPLSRQSLPPSIHCPNV
jgi:hypothetical protein